ncbi:DUF4157 domain-containing protein [Streptomyces sp. KS_5]|uniref:eCIS core domain-containing protein n=1 Tax=Streptomyces sp. KS_5 TaxID=1881018 RepID=UPI00210F0401|nr:DUF4157 domain-containing protein [Streptomyces sp. KS_5]
MAERSHSAAARAARSDTPRRAAVPGAGRQLGGRTRAFMERSFGRDFTDVRIHTDSEAAASATELSAQAYTIGSHIVFGAGAYAPGTAAGDALIAHELTHVVQQQGGGSGGSAARAASRPGDPSEAEARRTAEVVVSGGRVPRITSHPEGLYRQETGSPPGPVKVSPARTVFLDNNVFLEVARGNQQVAETLRAMVANPDIRTLTGRGIYEAELTPQPSHVTDAEIAARRAMVDGLNIEVADAGLEARMQTYDAYMSHGIEPGAPGPSRSLGVFTGHGLPGLEKRAYAKQERETVKDVPHMAEAQAQNAELWTLDKAAAEKARALGLTVAEESKIVVPRQSRQTSAENILRLIPEARAALASRAAVGSEPRTPASARAGQTQPSAGESPTPQSMVRMVVEQRQFDASGPSTEGGVRPLPDAAPAEGTRGKAAGPGYQTNAALQVIDAQGRQVAFELAQYTGGSQPHAEAEGVARLRTRLTGQSFAGGKLVVAVDQFACEGCLTRLRSFAAELGLTSYEVWAPTPQEGRTAGPKWTARTAATASARPAPAPVSETPGGSAYRYEPRMIQGETLAPAPTTPPARPAAPTAKSAAPSGGPESARATWPAPLRTTALSAAETPAPTSPKTPAPTSAKRLPSAPREPTELPTGRPGSVDLNGRAHADAAGAVLSAAVTRLNEVAQQHPEDKDLAWTATVINTTLGAESLLKDPKGFLVDTFKGAAFDAVFNHYGDRLASIKGSFDERFPSLERLHKDPVGTGRTLDSYRKDYYAARARLRVPDNVRVFLLVLLLLSVGKETPADELAQHLHELDEEIARAYNAQDYFEAYKWQQARYQFTLYVLISRLEQLSDEYADVPAGMANDLRARGQALHRAERVLRDTSQSLWKSGLVVFAPVLALAGDLDRAADGLHSIAEQFDSFASAVGTRQADYEREARRLRAETDAVADQPLFDRRIEDRTPPAVP